MPQDLAGYFRGFLQFTQVNYGILLMMLFWVKSPFGVVGRSNVSEKYAVSVFRAETLPSTNQTSRRLNPKEHEQNFHRR
jgi:hypothetical protein